MGGRVGAEVPLLAVVCSGFRTLPWELRSGPPPGAGGGLGAAGSGFRCRLSFGGLWPAGPQGFGECVAPGVWCLLVWGAHAPLQHVPSSGAHASLCSVGPGTRSRGGWPLRLLGSRVVSLHRCVRMTKPSGRLFFRQPPPWASGAAWALYRPARAPAAHSGDRFSSTRKFMLRFAKRNYAYAFARQESDTLA